MSPIRFLLSIPKGRDPALQSDRAFDLISSPTSFAGMVTTLWLDAATRTTSISNEGGFCIGSVFRRDSFREAEFVQLGNELSDVRANASRLLKDYWGSYLAVFHAGPGKHPLLMRDPTGMLPVYRVHKRGHVLYASDIGLLLEAGALSPAIDWAAVYGHLLAPDLRTARTCLFGVDEVAPGALHSSAGDREIGEQLWSPWDYSSPTPIPSFEDARDAVRNVVGKCVPVWLAPGEAGMVPVSGGLDSSIVCAALAHASRPFACVTVATRDPSGDERSYARRLASHFGVQLIERVYDVSQVDISHTAAAHLPRPVMKPFAQATHRAFSEAARITGSGCILDGNGGDNVFCFLHSSAPAADRFLRTGPRLGVFRTLVDLSRMTGGTIPVLTKLALKHAANRNPRYVWRINDQLLSKDARPSEDAPPLLPYLLKPRERQYGKLAHVALIMGIQNYVEGLDRTDPTGLVSPLLSQPIVETCLSVPTWLWCKGGVNRSVARAAFKDDLPEQVVSRVSKAGPDSFVYEIFRTYRSELREFLLDGLLSANGILDRASVELAFQAETTSLGETLYRLLDLADTEAWSRSWQSRRDTPHLTA